MGILWLVSVQSWLVSSGEVNEAEVIPTTTTRSLQIEEAFAAGIPFSRLRNPLLVGFSPATSLLNPRLALSGPLDFTFECRDLSVVETAADESSDSFLDSELACSTSGNSVYVNITSVKPILNTSKYTLTVTAINPSVIVSAYNGGDWSLLIRNSTSYLIDSSPPIPGFQLTAPIVVFSVLNVFNSLYGSERVLGVLGRLVLPIDLVTSDKIWVTSPAGFLLQTDSPDECDGFKWLTSGGTEYSIEDATVSCDGNKMEISIDGATGAQKNTDIRWTFNTINPATTPTPTENFWRAEILRSPDTTLYGQVSEGWQVIPQLADVTVTSPGNLKAATRVGEIFVSFTAISAADMVTLVAIEPEGFDFSAAVALLNGNEILDAFGNTISVRIAARENEECQVRIGNVRLGNSGGQTAFNITTYWGTEKKDEKTNFKGGFILPGLVTVVQSQLLSARQTAPDDNPVAKDFLIPYGVNAIGRLTVTFTQDISAGSTLRVALSSGFIARAENFAISVGGVSVSVSDVQVSSSNIVTLTVNALLKKNTESIILVACTSPDTPSSVNNEAISSGTWRIESFRPDEDLTGSPSNTNDGLDPIQRLVVPMTLTVVPASCLTCGQQQPPGANIAVSLDLRPNGSLPRRIYLIAPPGFRFSGPSCLRGYRGTDILSCVPAGTTVGDRPVARLETRVGGLTEPPSGLRITVITPEQSPADVRWQVRGVQLNGAVERETGWGESPGFPVLQMSQTVLYYPNIPTAQMPDPLNTKIWLTMGFRTKALFDMLDGSIEIIMPNTFMVYCDSLKIYKLPIDPISKCTVNFDRLTEKLRVTIGLNDTMSVTDYALAMQVQTPLATPQIPTNTFSVVLRDRVEDVKDAVFGIFAHTVTYGYPILAPSQVYWEADNVNVGDTLPTTGFTEIVDFFTRISFQVVQNFSGSQGVARIRIDFQPGVVLNKLQQTNTTGYGTTMSANLADRVSSITMTSTSIMMLQIDPTKVVLPVGVYSVTVPVTLPDAVALPAHQFYTITFCRLSGSCDRGNGTALILSHSIEGYQLLDVPPGMINASSGLPQISIFSALLCLLATLLN